MSAPQGGPEVSVIVPCRGHAEVLVDCLDALGGREASASFEVVVVDAAADDAVAEAAERYPFVRLVRSAEGLGPGPARNLGVEAARGSVLAFTDADCVPQPGWLAAATTGLESGARMVGGPVLHARPGNLIAVADNLQQFAEFPPTRPAGPATHFPTCNVALRAEDFRAAGGFIDERLGEDIVLSRAMAARWPDRVRFVPGMRVAHVGRTGWRSMLEHNRMLGEWRGRLRLLVGSLQLRLGRSWLSVIPFALWRWLYIVRTTARWHPAGLARVLLLTPLLLPGLTAWSIGFRRGVRLAMAEPSPEERP
jgi:glycosyltransferase involved in cell wall biosynthesis